MHGPKYTRLGTYVEYPAPPAQSQPEPPRPHLPPPSSAWGGPETIRPPLPSWDETPDGDLSWLGLLACLASVTVVVLLVALVAAIVRGGWW